MGVFFSQKDFRYSKGAPKTFMTSPLLERQFCGDCGTPVGHRYVVDGMGDVQVIFIGTLDDPTLFDGPGQHFGVESRLPKWIALDEDALQLRADEHPGLVEAWSGVNE
jgi:hypothetical protein